MNNQQVVIKFNDALNRRDLDTMMSLMSLDCVFENTSPPPDGTRYKGQSSVRAFWENFFSTSSSTAIHIDELFDTDNGCTMLWMYRWIDLNGVAGYIRGVDIYKLENGFIIEKLSYVKG